MLILQRRLLVDKFSSEIDFMYNSLESKLTASQEPRRFSLLATSDFVSSDNFSTETEASSVHLFDFKDQVSIVLGSILALYIGVMLYTIL